MFRELKKEIPADQAIGGALDMRDILDVLLLPETNRRVGLLRKPYCYRRVVDHVTGASWARH